MGTAQQSERQKDEERCRHAHANIRQSVAAKMSPARRSVTVSAAVEPVLLCSRERHARRFVLLAVILVFANGQIVKRFSADQMRLLHAEMDANHDEWVTHEEASRFVRNLRTVVMLKPSLPIMKSMDGNKDGSLSLDEFEMDLHNLKMDEVRKEGLV